LNYRSAGDKYLFINYHLIIVLLKKSSAAHRVHLPAGRRASTHSAQRTELAAGQQYCQDFITKDQWPSNLPNINPINYRVWGAMLEAYSKLKTKPKTIAEFKEALQLIWGNLPQEPIDQAKLSD